MLVLEDMGLKQVGEIGSNLYDFEVMIVVGIRFQTPLECILIQSRLWNARILTSSMYHLVPFS